MSVKTTDTLIHTLNIKGDYPCNKLRARKIWEVLYRKAGGKDFNDFDNFLIDLRCFEEQLDRQILEVSTVFYWAYWNGGNHTMTKVFTTEENHMLDDSWDSCYVTTPPDKSRGF